MTFVMTLICPQKFINYMSKIAQISAWIIYHEDYIHYSSLNASVKMVTYQTTYKTIYYSGDVMNSHTGYYDIKGLLERYVKKYI